MIFLTDKCLQELRQRFPDYELEYVHPTPWGFVDRVVRFYIPGVSRNIYYQYRTDGLLTGIVELRFEGDSIRYPREINLMNELYQTLSFMMALFDESIKTHERTNG